MWFLRIKPHSTKLEDVSIKPQYKEIGVILSEDFISNFINEVERLSDSETL